MKRLSIMGVAAAAACMLALTGCVGTTPYNGFKTPICATFKAPMPEYYSAIEAPPGQKLKHGTSVHRAYLSLISNGSMSVIEAAEKAGISKITKVEYEYNNVGLFMYQEITIHVYGY